ncbi:type IV toxin-antitoxin system AbiEi family antitoxin [Pantoea sp.]|uniref:type IV toxin-antitoxin system AbiEi family antitoxin n=1 Tax=Pantoea sp. TaxID=69393 RepID=UPI002897A9DE|nr:type IV toxin-antitoxin system AbiEi family antitoxin [Pantoea sp.]
MKQEQLLSDATEHLPEGFTLKAAFSKDKEGDDRAALTGPHGETAGFALEIKHIHRKETLMAVREKRARFANETPWLLICNRLTPALAQYCAAYKINFIDSVGNARIQVPGLYLAIEKKYEKNPAAAFGGRPGEGVMKLLFVLLSDPGLLNKPYRDLAELAGISLGMVSKAFDYLKQQRYYRKTKNGRRFINEDALLAMWIREYASALRPKLSQLSLNPPECWQGLAITEGEYRGGELAAAELSAGYLIPATGIIYTPHPLLQRRKELGLKPARDGQLQLIAAFWGDYALNSRAEAMLCLAELLASGDDRNREVARIINDKHLNLNESALFNV